MPSPLNQAGAMTDQSNYAPLHTNRWMTGLWTNRNQLRDAATPYLYEKFYSASRFDSLLGGLNGELTPKMTMGRRAGHSVYNSQTFPPLNRFAEFRTFSTTTGSIRVMADSAGNVYDATGPSRKLNIWDKSAGAGASTFQSVGNNLFFGDGLDQKKWVQAEPPWTPLTAFAPGKYIVDSNNNLQVAEGGITVGAVEVQIASNVLTLTLDGTDPNLPDNLMSLVGLNFSLSGFALSTFLNGTTPTISGVSQGQPAYTSNVLTAAFVAADYGPVTDTGSFTSGTGITGATPPIWATTIGAYTLDGGQQWICKGNSVENWGIAAPVETPSVAQTTLPTVYPAWTKNTYYSTCFLIYDEGNFVQKVTTFGTTGASEPIPWNDTTGGTTPDGSVIWTCQGSGVYASGTAYAAGAYVIHANSSGVLYFYQAANAGTTAATPPTFTSALNAKIYDNSVTWINVGIATGWGAITSSDLSGNFGIIPLQGGGSLVLGSGQNAAYGSYIGLPTGYSLANALTWSTPCTGFSGSGQVVSGVNASTSAGGQLLSSFLGEFSSFVTPATSNWIAVAWSAGAAVTVTTLAGLQFAQFTTLAGDVLCICTGPIHNEGTLPVPTGFDSAQCVSIIGAAGTDFLTHIMQGVQTCTLVATSPSVMIATLLYNDNDGNEGSGSPLNVFCIFYQLTGGVTASGTTINIPTGGTQSLAVIQTTLTSGASYTLPAGYATVSATCAMSQWIPHGSSHGHGWTCTLSGLALNARYQDDAGTLYPGGANIFAIATILANTTISPAQIVVDSNGALEDITISGVSSSSPPLWTTVQGALTTDTGATWRRSGITTGARTEPSQWAFAYKTSVTNHTSTASSLSLMVTLDANNYAFLQGPGSPDPQVDIIVIYRYAQGGSTLLYLDEIPAPPPGVLWQYEDQLPDSYLNELLPAAINHTNDPPPVGFRPLEYHLSRIFGYVANVLSWSNGTQQTGDPNQSYTPSNYFVYPSAIVRAWACTLGLIVFTVSDVYIVLGSATDADPLYTKKYIQGLGLLGYDAFTVNKTTPYLMNSMAMLLALDPSSGIIEPGFPIADQFDALYDPATAKLAWHEGAKGDTSLFVGDGTASWFRMAALSAPEQGLVWSPQGTLAAGYSAMQSVEVAAGKKQLLLGPGAAGGPILTRDKTKSTDNGVLYPWFTILGSVVLAQPGQIAELSFIAMESARIGTRPNVSVLLGEIDGATSNAFEQLPQSRRDPPLLLASKTLFADRYDMLQSQNPVWCRHLQIRFDWQAEDIPNELLTYTIFGAVHNETKSQ